MELSDHSLLQIDEEQIKKLTEEQLRHLSVKLLSDLKEARERLNQNSANSSRPPSTREPWFTEGDSDDTQEGDDDLPSTEMSGEDDSAKDTEESDESMEKNSQAKSGNTDGNKNPPGKQPNAQGYGRDQQLPVTEAVNHRPDMCACCGQHFDGTESSMGHNGHYEIDIIWGDESHPGIEVRVIKHIHEELECDCGHVTRWSPNREEEFDLLPGVQLTEWRLVGPGLETLIICLSLRMRLSRGKIREFLWDWLGIRLSVGTINQCIHEGGRAAVPVEDELVEEVLKSDLLHVDETSWKEKGLPLWLWVFTSVNVALFYVGTRAKEMVLNVLEGAYFGWLMTDGYQAYRTFPNRLRCWTHLLRKSQGLAECLDKEAQRFGKRSVKLLNILMREIYRARGGPYRDLMLKHHKDLEKFRNLCERMKKSEHEKTHALAVEFLNDWDAIFRILSNPYLPLTNNEAERMLRHWVISRKISYGTRTEQGSRILALLASVIETCRKRNASPWKYLEQVIKAGRSGNQIPTLPAVGL